jgi:cytidyltransferase-like protein
MDKVIFNYSDIDLLLEKTQNSKKILIGGCFDLLHYGHFFFLKKAKELGGKLIVALESDEHIKKMKGRNSIHDISKRAEMLKELVNVDYVVKLPLFSKDTEYEDLVLKIRPNFIAVTQGDLNFYKKKKHAELVGATVVEVAPNLTHYSTSKILEIN